MPWDIATITKPVARKEHDCDACRAVLNAGPELTASETVIMQRAKSEGYKILKNTKYFKCEGMYEGNWDVFRARQDVNEIVENHGLYDE